MKYTRFEDLPVWQAAIELAERVCPLTRNRFFAQPGDLRDPLPAGPRCRFAAGFGHPRRSPVEQA